MKRSNFERNVTLERLCFPLFIESPSNLYVQNTVKMNIKKEKFENCEKFDKLVWARMRFLPYWPAKMVESPPSMGKVPRGKSCVLFFGTKEL